MQTTNGVTMYEPEDKLPLPEGLQFDSSTESRFGFKVATSGGRVTWELGTEADFRKAEAQRQGIREADVILPADTPMCHALGAGPTIVCTGACNSGFCRAYSMEGPFGTYYYCQCSGGH